MDEVCGAGVFSCYKRATQPVSSDYEFHFISFHSGGPAYVLNSQADADGPWAVVWTFILANFHSQNYTACPWPLKMFPPERGAVSTG